MKLFILYENEDWMLPIRSALEDANLPYINWHIDEIIHIDYNTPPPIGLFWNRMSPSSHHRGHKNFAEKTAQILHWLEHHKRPIINGYRTWQLEINKMNQYMALSSEGIVIPRTIAIFEPNNIRSAALEIGFPLIMKHNCGGKGIGVSKLSNINDLEEFIISGDHKSPDGILLAQEYITPAEPFITRIEIVGDSLIYAVRVNTELGYELCPADSCVTSTQICPASDNGERFSIVPNFENQVVEQYKRFMQHNDISVAGIEMVTNIQGKIYTYDVNMNTNYNTTAESKIRINANKAVASFILAKLSTFKG